MQLTDMSEWTIAQQYLNGSDAHKTTYTYNDESLYVMVPYENTVEDASATVASLLNGTAETTQSQMTDSK
jgi:hypothetical protein